MEGLQQDKRCLAQRLDRLIAHKNKLEDYQKYVQDVLNITEKGMYTPRIRGIVRFMVARSCPLCNVGDILNYIYQTLLKPMLNPLTRVDAITLDRRTVRRILEEGLIAARLQLYLELMRSHCKSIVHALKAANSRIIAFTSGSDGTTHRSLNYESLHYNLHAPDTYSPDGTGELKQKIRFGGIRVEANHRTDTQIDGENTYLKTLADTFSRAPVAAIAHNANIPISENQIWLKWVGTHGDHAKDQKAKHRRLEELKKEKVNIGLGEREFYSLTADVQAEIVGRAEDTAIEKCGQASWDSLTATEQDRRIQSVFEESLKELAHTVKDKLSKEDLEILTDFLWVGCQMHKDLNAVKGGYQSLRAFWKTVAHAPCTLANRDNAVILEAAAEGLANESAATHAAASSVGGAIKLSELMGALLNHKDDKKGHQDVFRDYAKVILGLTFTFPDTSNTRFGSYLEAAAEIITRCDFYLMFLEHVRNLKEKRNWNHMETNIHRALTDNPTRTELAILTLYLEAVSHPYIVNVRGTNLEESNALDKGELHAEVVVHINKLIANPDLILSLTAAPEHATLCTQKSWKRPESIRAVHDMAPTLPSLREAFVAFLEGAKKTWIRFSAEFAEGGRISTLTEEQKKQRWMPTTNDANEGALGQARVFKNRNPTAGDSLLNSIMLYTKNNTQDFVDFVLVHDEDQAFLRSEGRASLNEKQDQKKRRMITEQHIQESDARRAKDESNAQRKRQRVEHLASIDLVTNARVIETMSLKMLLEQLAKYREIDKEHKPATVKRKDECKAEVLAAAARYMRKCEGERVSPVQLNLIP